MVFKTKGFLLGAAAGALLTGAGAVGATAGFNAANDGPRPMFGVERPELIKAQNITPSLVRPPSGAPLSFADIIERVSPAVVSLEVVGTAPRNAAAQRRVIPPQLEEFFGIPRGGQGAPGTEPDEDEESASQRTQASGSGFFISGDGYIVTNNHVVENAREITVHLSDDRELTARVVGRDEETDLAVLKVEGRNFPFVQFAANAQPRVGDWVVAIGNPFQLNGTATAGIVSALGRDIGDTAYVNYLQIDAPINRGNSGGPTFDLNGRVIGVNTAIYSTSGSSAGVGFAIPADTADQVTRQLISGRQIARGYLGVSLAPTAIFDKDAAEALGLRSDDGALVAGTTAGGPAERAGLQGGDVVLRVNGQAIEDSNDLTRRVASARAGETIRLDIWRDGRTRTVNVVSGTRPPRNELLASTESGQGRPAAPREPAVASTPPVLGMQLSDLDEATRRRLDIRVGVQIDRVEPRSDAAEKGVQRGYLLTRVGSRDVASVAEVQGAVEAARRAGQRNVLLWFRRPTDSASSPLAIPLQPSTANG